MKRERDHDVGNRGRTSGGVESRNTGNCNFFVDFSENPPPPAVADRDNADRYETDPRRPRPAPSPSRPEKKVKKKRKKGWLIFLLLLLLIVGGAYYLFSGLSIKPLSKDLTALGIDPAIEERYKDAGITNVALFGVDTRDYETDTGRSDAIMIISVDNKNNRLKLTSVLRDSYVSIEGHGQEKITHAYVYGGPELAIKTLNQNFRLNIKNYVTVNFAQMAGVVDAIGGVDIEISEAERIQINGLANQEGMWAPEIPSAGSVHLNGTQATAFSRIRSIDTDTARAGRQRMVMEAMLHSVKETSVFKYPGLVREVLSHTETSVDYAGVARLSPAVLFGDASMEQYIVPSEEDTPYGGEVDGSWVWTFDIPAATERLHRFIYGDV